MIVIGPLAAAMLQLGVSRQREYLADATAARMLGEGRSLADALTTLEQGRKQVPMQVNPATETLYIVNPLSSKGVAGLFSTHPPIEERIKRLREYATRAGIHYG
jgi:heat shock protein HtpX